MATTIREVLDRLSDKDRKLLEYCHEAEIPNFIKVDGFIIGVYKQPKTQTIMEAGDWYVAEVKNESLS